MRDRYSEMLHRIEIVYVVPGTGTSYLRRTKYQVRVKRKQNGWLLSECDGSHYVDDMRGTIYGSLSENQPSN